MLNLVLHLICVAVVKIATIHYFYDLTTKTLKRAYHNYWVYIVTNKPKGTLYIGVTGGLDDRMERHVAGTGSDFTKKYRLKQLVHYEEFLYINDALKREKQLKNWHREWKINLIEKDNPEWKNLWSELDPETSSG